MKLLKNKGIDIDIGVNMKTHVKKNLTLVPLLCIIVCLSSASGEELLPEKDMLFWDHTQPLEKRVKDLASRLTLIMAGFI